ncbi:MAG TPA: penicillin-binding protein activator [Pyrinomonadaceae bacterium]
MVSGAWSSASLGKFSMTLTTSSYRSGVILTTIFICAICCQAQPGQSESGSTRQQANAKQRANAALSDAKVNEAISRLSALVVEAQTLNPALRSHIQTQVASLLWKIDKLFAHDVFLRAWEAAESADRELGEKQDSSGKSPVASYPHDARREVISAAWKMDPALGEQLFARMIKNDEQDQSDSESLNNSSNALHGYKLSPSELQRINVATQLLENGETEQAAKFAGEALNLVVTPTLRFLSELREKNATAADELYVSLLARIVTDPTADGNTVSLLSSYIFSPYLYVTIGSNGFPILVQNTGPIRPVDVSPSIRSMFLNAAAQILLRTPSNPTAQRISYMVATRLLPLFDRFNSNLATQLRSRLSEIASSIPSALKSPEVVNNVRKGVNNTDPTESIQELLEGANHARDSDSRNRLYIRAATLAAESGDDDKATSILQELDPDDLRNRVRAYVFILLAKHALERKNIQKALKFASSEDLPPIERVWIYTEAAEIIKIKRGTNLTDVIMDAVSVARRMEAMDPNKARALTAVALQLMRYNSQLAKPYLIEAITAANKADSLNSEDAVLEIRLQTPLGDWGTSYGAPNFALKNLFRELAKDDFFQAINMVDNLRNKEALSVATVAIADVVLTRKNLSTP